MALRSVSLPRLELERRWREARARYPRLALGAVGTLASLTVLTLVFVAWFVSSLWDGLPDQSAIARIGDMNQATTVYDEDDRPAFAIFTERRIEVAIQEISPHLIRAIVAIEDQRFFNHHGFDAFRIASAALANLRLGRAAQGGSTITQQLARQSFLSTDKTLRRKLQELILADQIERRFSKERILELFLNKVYFGDGLYGAEAASRGYFGKRAADVSLAEAALLAGLVKAPSAYAPTIAPDLAVARRNVVLQAMLDTRQIDRSAWEAARTAPVVLQDVLRADEPHGQYFKEQVRRELVDRFGWHRVYEGGLRVFSTVNMEMQTAAETSVAEALVRLEQRRQARAARRSPSGTDASPSNPLQAALIAMDPATGHVRAMVGGRDFEKSPFNRAVQARRQPGSAFKPFIYAVALEQGYSPGTIIDHLNDSVATLQGSWTPEDEHSSVDQMSLRTGLRISSNRAAVRLLQQVGIGPTVQYAKRMGMGDVPGVPSLALGSGEVTLQSLTAAYAAFANHGRVPTPVVVRRVEDRSGHLLYASEDAATQAVSDTTAYLVSTMMADVINAGTGARARQLGFTLPAAGKTGTTNEFNDAWFIGFTPHLATGVWVGFDQPHTILPNGFAADVAVPLWAGFMKEATRRDKAEWLAPPPGIVAVSICRVSGMLATEGCRDETYTELFARGTEPRGYCELHPTKGLFGAIASLFHVGEKPAPVKIEAAGAPPPGATVAVNDGVPIEPPQSEPAKKRRGFWSRLFSREK